MEKKKVLVAMSGGVDSSLSAALLQTQGFDVAGVTLYLTGSASSEGANQAREVARKLKIPHQIIDVSKEFEHKVVDAFCREYLAGRTPNPCVVCNQKIKFGVLLGRAQEMGIDFLATGHYANKSYDNMNGRFLLEKGKDPKKDQSYFLFSLSQDQLRSVIFPLGELNKPEVRKKSKEFDLMVSDKPESQEVCFVPHDNYVKFIMDRFPGANQPGLIVSTDGKILGEHRGIFSFTIGQRKGLKIAMGHPLYVVSLNKATNTVVVGRKEEAFQKELIVTKVNWISFEPPNNSLNLKVKIRYQQQEHPARIIPLSEGEAKVEFSELQLAITPGQAAVFYDGNTVVGGGWIK